MTRLILGVLLLITAFLTAFVERDFARGTFFLVLGLRLVDMEPRAREKHVSVR